MRPTTPILCLTLGLSVVGCESLVRDPMGSRTELRGIRLTPAMARAMITAGSPTKVTDAPPKQVKEPVLTPVRDGASTTEAPPAGVPVATPATPPVIPSTPGNENAVPNERIRGNEADFQNPKTMPPDMVIPPGGGVPKSSADR